MRPRASCFPRSALVDLLATRARPSSTTSNLVRPFNRRVDRALGRFTRQLSAKPRMSLAALASERGLPKLNERQAWRGLATLPPPPELKDKENPEAEESEEQVELRESPYTIPNALTIARIIACPFLGYNIIHGNYEWATGILFAGGFSDWLDGWIARKWKVKSVLGSILDPAADKALMTTLVGTLAWAGLLPIPLAVIIFGRDFALSISAFYFRYISLPPPRTLKRYFDPSMPSAEVKPTQISKINTALQLLLMGVTTVSPLVQFPISGALTALQWTVAGTTIWSGFSYIGLPGYKILQAPKKSHKL